MIQQRERQYFDLAVVVPLEDEIISSMEVFPSLEDLSTATTFCRVVDSGSSDVLMIVMPQQAMGRTAASAAAGLLLAEYDIGLVVCLGIAGSMSDDMGRRTSATQGTYSTCSTTRRSWTSTRRTAAKGPVARNFRRPTTKRRSLSPARSTSCAHSRHCVLPISNGRRPEPKLRSSECPTKSPGQAARRSGSDNPLRAVGASRAAAGGCRRARVRSEDRQVSR